MNTVITVVQDIGVGIVVAGFFTLMFGVVNVLLGMKNDNGTQVDRGVFAIISGAIFAVSGVGMTAAIVTALNTLKQASTVQQVVADIGVGIVLAGLFAALFGIINILLGMKNDNGTQVDRGVFSIVAGAIMVIASSGLTAAIVTALGNLK